MPKKKEPDLTPEEQFKRFQEAAKEHEIEELLPEIEQAFKKLSCSTGGRSHALRSARGSERKSGRNDDPPSGTS